MSWRRSWPRWTTKDDRTMTGITDTRTIKLANGQVLTVEMTDAFADRVRQRYGLLADSELTNGHVQEYVLGAVEGAVARAEREVTDVERTDEGTA